MSDFRFATSTLGRQPSASAAGGGRGGGGPPARGPLRSRVAGPAGRSVGENRVQVRRPSGHPQGYGHPVAGGYDRREVPLVLGDQSVVLEDGVRRREVAAVASSGFGDRPRPQDVVAEIQGA